MKQITIAGNIGKDAEVRRTNDGTPVCNFNVAVNEPGKKDAPPIWFGVSIWGKRGETLSQYLSKGTKVCVSGDLQRREHEGKTYLEVRADQVTIMGGGQRQEQQVGSGYGAGGRPSNDLDDAVPFAPEWRL